MINCFISSGEYGNYDEMRDKPPIVWIFGTMLSGAFDLWLLIKRPDTDYKRILFVCKIRVGGLENKNKLFLAGTQRIPKFYVIYSEKGIKKL